MLPPQENELITRIGAGTPMGNTMRRYWIPACLSSEIAEPDGPPVRVRLLGEDLVAFRDSDGRIGLVDEFCPHRRFSLYPGATRNAGSDASITAGNSTSRAIASISSTSRPSIQFKHHIHLTAYPTVRAGPASSGPISAPVEKMQAPKFRLDPGRRKSGATFPR